MFITQCPNVTLQLHNFDLFRTSGTSSFCTVAWQLARFQLTRRIARHSAIAELLVNSRRFPGVADTVRTYGQLVGVVGEAGVEDQVAIVLGVGRRGGDGRQLERGARARHVVGQVDGPQQQTGVAEDAQLAAH